MSSKKGPKAITQRTVAGAVAGLPVSYPELLEGIKSRIRSAKIKASLSANRRLMLLSWGLGWSIVDWQ